MLVFDDHPSSVMGNWQNITLDVIEWIMALIPYYYRIELRER
jgi:hypothetical protein